MQNNVQLSWYKTHICNQLAKVGFIRHHSQAFWVSHRYCSSEFQPQRVKSVSCQALVMESCGWLGILGDFHLDPSWSWIIRVLIGWYLHTQHLQITNIVGDIWPFPGYMFFNHPGYPPCGNGEFSKIIQNLHHTVPAELILSNHWGAHVAGNLPQTSSLPQRHQGAHHFREKFVMLQNQTKNPREQIGNMQNSCWKRVPRFFKGSSSGICLQNEGLFKLFILRIAHVDHLHQRLTCHRGEASEISEEQIM